MAISVVDIVRWEHQYPDPDSTMRWCTHTRNVISLHLRVRGTTVLGAESWRCDGPLLALIAAGERNGNGLIGGNSAWWCFFDGPEVETVPGGMAVAGSLGGQRIQRSHFRALSDSEASVLAQTFASAHALWRRCDLESRLNATARIHELLAAWCAPPSGGIRADQGLAERYRRLIEESSTDADMDLSALAVRLDRSADHLAGLFRAAFGCTPVAYRQRVRLAIATELLSTSCLGVEAVARRCGFPSTAHFTRSFSRAYASSPRAWARDVRIPAGG